MASTWMSPCVSPSLPLRSPLDLDRRLSRGRQLAAFSSLATLRTRRLVPSSMHALNATFVVLDASHSKAKHKRQ